MKIILGILMGLGLTEIASAGWCHMHRDGPCCERHNVSVSEDQLISAIASRDIAEGASHRKFNHYKTDALASIVCPVNEVPGQVRWVHGNIQFLDDFEFYGPRETSITGDFTIKLSSQPRDTHHLTMTGSYIQGPHLRGPHYWIVSGMSEEGQFLQLTLEQRDEEDEVYGEILLQNGKKLKAVCTVKFEFSRNEDPDHHCHPLSPC